MHPTLIILVTLLFGIGSYFISKWNQQHGGWFIALGMGYSLICPWVLIARFSKNLAFDGLLFDVCIMSGFYLTLLVKEGKGWHPGQYVALAVALLSLLAFKLLEQL